MTEFRNRSLTTLTIAVALFSTSITNAEQLSDEYTSVAYDTLNQEIKTGEQALESARIRLQEMLAMASQDSTESPKLKADSVQLSTQLSKLQQEVESKRRDLAKTKNQITRVTSILNDKQRVLSGMQARVAELQQQRDAQAVALEQSSQEVQNSVAQLAELDETLQATNRQLKLANDSILQLEHAIQTVATEYSVATTDKDQQQNKLASLAGALAERESELSDAKKLLAAKQQQLTNDQNKLTATKAEIETLKQRNNELQATASSPNNDADENQALLEVNAQLASVTRELQTQEAALAQERAIAEKINALAKARRAEVDEFERENFSIYEKIGWTELRIEQHKKTLVREQQKQQKATRKLAQSETALAKQKAIFDRLTTEHKTYLEEQKNLEAAIDEAQRERESAAIRNDQTKSAIAVLRQDTKLAKKELAATRRTIALRKKELRTETSTNH